MPRKSQKKRIRNNKRNKSWKNAPSIKESRKLVVRQSNRISNSVNKKKRERTLLKNLLILVTSPLLVFVKLFSEGYKWVEKKYGRTIFLKLIIGLTFVATISTLTNLQITTRQEGEEESVRINTEIIRAKRGDIYIKDIKLSRDNVKITSSRRLSTITLEPDKLKKYIDNGNFTKDDVVNALASSLNLPRNEIYAKVTAELITTPIRSYTILERYATQEQGEIINKMRNKSRDSEDDKMNYHLWLTYNTVDLRDYPESEMLASTLGYVQRTKVPRDEALKGCEDMVEQNERRKTYESYSGYKEDSEYSIGYYGLEQKFCSVLSGLNGRGLMNNEPDTTDVDVVNGANLYLTIDRNLQKKAEEILAKAVKDNTNKNGGPKNGTILIINLEDTNFADAGAILAMASYPKVDPNKEGFTQNDLKGFSNTATMLDYEPGSVIKPLTVASGLNQWFTKQTDEDGDRIGLDPSWQFIGYDWKGKPFQEANGNIVYIKNAGGKSYGTTEKWGIKDCLRLSINTCLSDIEPQIGTSLKKIEEKRISDHSITRNYFEERFMIGKETIVDLPGDTHGLMTPNPLEEEEYNDFSYASFGFGQGFRMSPLQVARAYTAIAREDGTIVEPFIIDKIEYEDGKIDDGWQTDSLDLIKKHKPIEILHPDAANTVSNWLVYTLDKYGEIEYGNVGHRGYVPGYPIAAKTGTAQVSRMDNYKNGNCIVGESIHDCNTRLGIYDQTFVGYGPVGLEYQNYPKILVLVKLSEPKPGEEFSYAVLNLGRSFSDTMKYTMEYLGIPKNLK